LFFFSSRRRHTSFSRDWSSDVCSSDLLRPVVDFSEQSLSLFAGALYTAAEKQLAESRHLVIEKKSQEVKKQDEESRLIVQSEDRSEERRVGKECRSGWWA